MGDISIIARRLSNGYVQYGWSGNGGYYRNVGARLYEWYQNPDDVDYLFNLGQTRLIGRKGSEKGGYDLFETHQLTYAPFWLGKTEHEIFSKIAFIDFCYFYELDNKWYYIIVGPFSIKIPFVLIQHHLQESGYEFEYCRLVKRKIVEYIFTEYKETNKEFADFLEGNGYGDINFVMDEIMKNTNDPDDMTDPVYELYKRYNFIFEYFDDWVLIIPDESGTEIAQIIMRKKEEVHIETSHWVSCNE